MTFDVQSETGQLRQVIVHRPGLELSRLTPRNIGELLFDDVLWAKRAKEEHDAFAEVLREAGVRVHYFGQLLGETLERPEGRSFVLDRLCTPEPATVEGGDVHVLGHGAVMIGMGERSTPMAAELLAAALFRAGQARTVIAVELPASRAMMHLDTVLTMIDRAAEREQWDDGTNYLAVAPGVIVGYERNVATNTMLRKHGIEVITTAGRNTEIGARLYERRGPDALEVTEEVFESRASIVVCAGGGVPVVGCDGGLRGVEAVVDKDLSDARALLTGDAGTLVAP
jgi:arginine deiminase